MFAQIILPLSVSDTFTYEIPEQFLDKIKIGHRVFVEFGGRKLYTGIIESIHENRPEKYSIKNIISVIDKEPIITKTQLDLWKFISSYYLCSLGEVYRNVIPSALKLESETFIRLRQDKILDISTLDEYETLIIQAILNKSSISLKEIEDFIPKKYIISTLKYLYEEGFIEIDEKIIPKYKRKEIPYVKLHEDLEENPEKLKEILHSIDKIDRQRDLFLQFLSYKSKTKKPIEKKELLEITQSSPAILKALENKNILKVYYLFKDRLKKYQDKIEDLLPLSKAQNLAFEQIKTGFSLNKIVLLYGITSSGKTEIYFHQILKSIKDGKQILFLLPEIAITTQIIYRLQRKFGDEVGIYHSKLSTNEKVEVWMNCLQNKYKILIGTRSSIFLPFQNLDLIIVDEEHDSSYKQNDPKPFYNARDCAIYLSKKLNINCLLGSATPSLESYYYAKIEKYHLVELKERFGETPLPELELISLKDAHQNQEMIGEFTLSLRDEIQKTIEENKQVLIFMNRRGFAPILECNTCGFVPKCPNCDVNLTFHKFTHDLKCHYCGYKEGKSKKCKVCNSDDISTKGIGTQLIEEQLFEIFKDLKIERMDIDTMRKKDAYEKLFEKMSLMEIDILVGTQMISKGLDFDHIGLVGIIRADSLLHLSDFRAQERAMQLLIQLSGRAGRRKNQGKMLIQTFQENSLFFQNIKNKEIESIYLELIKERKEFNYPPFTKIIELTLRHKNQEKVRNTASFLTKILAQGIKDPFLLGPVEPELNKINNVYLNKILIKIPVSFSISKTKNFIKESIFHLQDYKTTKSVLVNINVDPN